MGARRKKVAVLATLDSKGPEVGHLKQHLETLGREVVVLDVGTAGEPALAADVPRETIAAKGRLETAGTDPANMLEAMGDGARAIIEDMLENADIGAVVGVGGGKGSALFHNATRGLPFGFPKVLITSARPALLSEIATTSDTIMMPTLVDLFGLNRFTRVVIDNAAAVLSQVDWSPPSVGSECMVAITAFGVTSPAVRAIKACLADAGIEAVVFPANGAGGRTMEALIRKGQFDGVIDLTTTELADLLLGGTASAGEERLTAAAAVEIPQLIAPGAVDMANFGPPETVPERYADRITYRHTPMTTLVRTTAGDTAEIARMTARRLRSARGPTAVFWPEHGVSDYDKPGHAFHDPAANAAWRKALGRALRSDIPVIDTDNHINDPAFAMLCADWMIGQLKGAA